MSINGVQRCYFINNKVVIVITKRIKKTRKPTATKNSFVILKVVVNKSITLLTYFYLLMSIDSKLTLTKTQCKIHLVWILNTFMHCFRLPPCWILWIMNIGQICCPVIILAEN